MLTLNRRSDPVVTPQQQYALVMLDEEQVSQLLGRPQMRRVNALPHAYDPHVRYMRLRRRLVAAATVLVMAATGWAAWRWLPRSAAGVFPWSAEAPPTVGTAASFNVAVAAPPSADAAARVAAQLRGLALPVFTRRQPNTRAHQVMVGPYVSLDEAEAAQRFLRTRGYGSGRMFVDESVRNAPRNEVRSASVGTNPGVLLVGAPDRLSLVLELDTQPRRVDSRRVNETTLEIDLGPLPNPIRAQQWSAPVGVHLIKQVSLEEVAGAASPGGHLLRANVVLPEFSQASVRVDDKRVYVDLTWPQNGGDADVAPPVQARTAPAEAVESAPAPRAQANPAYREQLETSIDRFDEATPFLLSASKSPSPPVLAALSQTLTSLEQGLAGLSVPSAAADGYKLMVAGVKAARVAVDPGFAGDRAGQMQQAVKMFQGGKAALPQ